MIFNVIINNYYMINVNMSDINKSKLYNIASTIVNNDVGTLEYYNKNNNLENIKLFKNNNLMTYACKCFSNKIINKLCILYPSLINKKDNNGDTGILIISSLKYKNGCELLKTFILNGANINCQNKDGNTPLIMATKIDNMEYIKLLINNGADCNIKNNNGESIYSILFQNKKINNIHSLVKENLLLINEYSYFNYINHNNFESYEMFKNFVLKFGELMINNIKIEDTNTILEYVIENEYDELDYDNYPDNDFIEYIINMNVELNGIDSDTGDTPIIKLINNLSETDNINIIYQLIEKGADINIKNNDDETALSIAVENDYYDLVAKLIDKGADINVIINNNETPLIVAINNQRYTIASLLIDKGANVDYCSNDNNTALMECAKYDNIDIAIKIINKSVEINKTDNILGDTALMIALKNYSIDIAKILLRNGADINIKNYIKLNSKDIINCYKEFSELINNFINDTEEDNNVKKIYDNSKCSICLNDITKKILYYPCLHVSCLDCSSEIYNCHICRRKINDKILLN